MSAKLRQLSGKEVLAILRRFGFSPLSTRGSHVKLRRITADGEKQTLVVPLHEQLDRGTLRAIMRQSSRYIPEQELRPHFYTS